MTWSGAQIGIAFAVMAVGAALQGAVGFGVSLVAAPLLVLIDPRLVPGPLLVAGLTLTLLMTHRERHGIDRAGVGLPLIGSLPGTLLGAAALAALPRDATAVVIGALVLVAVGLSASGWRLRPTRWAAFGAGAASGFMGTVTAIGGPPIALLYQDWAGARLRGTLSGFFVLTGLASLASLTVFGRFGLAEIRAGLVLVPGIVVGFAASSWIAPRLEPHHTRIAILVVSASAALAVILRGVL